MEHEAEDSPVFGQRNVRPRRGDDNVPTGNEPICYQIGHPYPTINEADQGRHPRDPSCGPSNQPSALINSEE